MAPFVNEGNMQASADNNNDKANNSENGNYSASHENNQIAVSTIMTSAKQDKKSSYGSVPGQNGDAADADADATVNPFLHRLNLNPCHVLQIAVLSLTLLPLRVVGVVMCLFLNYAVASVGLVGVSEERLEAGPLTGWRRGLQGCCYALGRAMYFCLGVHWISVKGKQATPSSAPVLVMAPHATLVDLLAVMHCRGTAVAKDDFAKMPIVGKICTFIQVLFVKREEQESRRRALDQIRRHVGNVQQGASLSETSGERSLWRQLVLYPEGTNTNGRALIHFKAGAFQNGAVGVQPVLLRFPSRPDTITYTWDQNYGAKTCIWLTMCQFNTRMQIEFLPAYRPAPDELADPRVLARNVRLVMAKALGVPTVDRRLEDGKMAAEASRDQLNILIGDDDDEDYDPKRLGYNYVAFAGNMGLAA